MTKTYREYQGVRNSMKYLAHGLTARTMSELWILTTLAQAEAPMWGRAIDKAVTEATRVVRTGVEVFSGYVLAQGTLGGLLNDYRAQGLVEVVELEAPPRYHLERRRVAYRITDLGREHLVQLKRQFAGEILGAKHTVEQLWDRLYGT